MRTLGSGPICLGAKNSPRGRALLLLGTRLRSPARIAPPGGAKNERPAELLAGRSLAVCFPVPGLVERAVVRTFAGRSGLRSVDGPGKDERQRVDVAVRQDWITEVRPSVPH
jgi:hypothetical protein